MSMTQEILNLLYEQVDSIMRFGDKGEVYDFISGLAEKYNLVYPGDEDE